MKWAAFVVAFVTLSGLPATSRANPIGPSYPPPGGVSVTSTGSVDQAGGATLTFTGFNPSAWSDLFWLVQNGNLGNANFDTTTDTGIASKTVSGNTIDYTLSTPWTFLDTQTNSDVSGTVQLIQTFTDLNNVAITSLFDTGSGGPGVLPITAATLTAWGGGYNVNQIYKVNGTDAASFYAAFHGGPNPFDANTNGTFFYDPVQAGVPEPVSLLLLGTGLTMVGLRRRARR